MRNRFFKELYKSVSPCTPDKQAAHTSSPSRLTIHPNLIYFPLVRFSLLQYSLRPFEYNLLWRKLMNIRILAATVAGAIVMFFLGWLIFGVILMSYLQANMTQYEGLQKIPPDFRLLIPAQLAWAWLYAFVFDHWAGIKTFLSGLTGGVLLGFPISVGINLQFESFMELYKGVAPMIVDILASTLWAAIAGGVIGLVLGLMSKKTATTE